IHGLLVAIEANESFVRWHVHQVAVLLFNGLVAVLEAVFEDVDHGAEGHGPLLRGKRVPGSFRAAATGAYERDLEGSALRGMHMRQDDTGQGGRGGDSSGGFDEIATRGHCFALI